MKTTQGKRLQRASRRPENVRGMLADRLRSIRRASMQRALELIKRNVTMDF